MTRIRFQKIKALVLSVIVILFVNNIAVANEKVTISIDGESYSRDIPEDYDAVVKLLQYVAELERNADLQAFEVSKKYDDSINSYEKQISELYTEINSLKLTLDQALKDADKTEKDINKLTKTNTAESKRELLLINNSIESSMEGDELLKRFEEQFDLVNNNFMQRLSQKHPDLSGSERLMCAYLKMNLSTKEMAPLLNISVRGVETMRYRIRKKFNLDREMNLIEYINSFS